MNKSVSWSDVVHSNSSNEISEILSNNLDLFGKIIAEVKPKKFEKMINILLSRDLDYETRYGIEYWYGVFKEIQETSTQDEIKEIIDSRILIKSQLTNSSIKIITYISIGIIYQIYYKLYKLDVSSPVKRIIKKFNKNVYRTHFNLLICEIALNRNCPVDNLISSVAE